MASVPLYPIGIVAELLGISSASLRLWDKQGIVQPKRWHGSRCYSDSDLQRLLFVKRLLDEGFNLIGIRFYLKLYHCWSKDDCVPLHKSTEVDTGKPCWKRLGAFCGLAEEQRNICNECSRNEVGERPALSCLLNT